jgi:GIY-YIG catalytic domain
LEEKSLKTDKNKTYAQHRALECSECSTLYTSTKGGENTSTSEEQYSELSKKLNVEIKPVKYYNNMYDFKSIFIKDNKNKSGIYKFTNKLNGNFYIGSSLNLSKRFTNYFSLSYLSKIKNHLTISRALIKYSYYKF